MKILQIWLKHRMQEWKQLLRRMWTTALHDWQLRVTSDDENVWSSTWENTANHFYCVKNNSRLSLGLNTDTIHWEHTRATWRDSVFGVTALEKYNIFQQLKTIKISPVPPMSSCQNKMECSSSQSRRYFFILLYWMYVLLQKRLSVFAPSLWLYRNLI